MCTGDDFYCDRTNCVDSKMNNLPEPIADRRRYERRQSNVRELLELSTLYHHLISDLCDVFDVTATAAQRSRAFQVVSDFVEQLEAGK